MSHGAVGKSVSYAYDAANRLTVATGAGASTYSSDAAGNTLAGGGRTNTWDSQNRLTQCAYGGTSNAFTYGADGLRRHATVNGTATDYMLDGDMAVREMQGGARFATYLTGPRGPECRVAETATPSLRSL